MRIILSVYLLLSFANPLLAQKNTFPLDSVTVYRPFLHGIRINQEKIKSHFDASALEDGFWVTNSLYQMSFEEPSEEDKQEIKIMEEHLQNAILDLLPSTVFRELITPDEEVKSMLFKQSYAFIPQSRNIAPKEIPSVIQTYARDYYGKYAIYLGADIYDLSSVKGYRIPSAQAFFLIFDLQKNELLYGKTWSGNRKSLSDKKGALDLVKLFYEGFKMYLKYKK